MNKKANNLDSSLIKQNSHSSIIQSINSIELLGKDGVVYIQHNGELYQLRQTKAGKLILTK
ncbi:hemin uptake protein HemP [Proteus cibarius]|uniref:Hemin uptake protein HemP n=1 Tax=Proteus terrae subsp. cibarius TaxID=626774 RepID=A0A6G6S5Y8_9GAMM|nr:MULTISPECIES: hemin uptake protein HemP [Proteus]QHP76300.1 hemin uptake protein HemP [Proteus vulgaris]MBG2912954.1 hemin uptake protein HemP [Proteus terrae subsp. cibarius]MBG3091399.1 hemin uptake protein HemP [Proteus terrae subsp. cibarius]MBG6038156.1 hemin uptake protein HemP [Proteus terrae subsp. cibarius]MCM2365933.1 hemin uptake protein HemP [Proteus sp. FZP2095]